MSRRHGMSVHTDDFEHEGVLYPLTLMYFLTAHDDADQPDGAWQAIIENAVTFYNEENGTDFDPFDGWMAYNYWCEANNNG